MHRKVVKNMSNSDKFRYKTTSKWSEKQLKMLFPSENIKGMEVTYGQNFKPIPNFEGYFISERGIVLSLDGKYAKPIPLMPCDNGNGYKTVTLYRNGKCYKRYIHRLVAEVYLDNPLGLPQVNHLDGVTSNNALYNLQWCTALENIRHAQRLKIMRKACKGRHISSKSMLEVA